VFPTDPRSAELSLAEVLQTWAGQCPDSLAFGFLIDGEEEGPRLTYGDLDREARTVAAALQDVAGPDERALLQYPPGLDFISAFFGCLYAGVLPVPAYPPRFDRLAQSGQVLAGIAADCRPRVLLTSAALAGFLQGATLGAKHCIATNQLDRSLASRWREPKTDPDAPALLQYTSGSTASPKGVVVTHRNLMHNEAMIEAALEHCGPGGGVSWLPPYHDLGLVGGILQSVYHGGWCRLMSPLAFLQKPFRWLQAMARYRGDTGGGPNFAFDLCVQRISPEEKASLDLRHWSIAAIGSEPVSAETMDRFAVAFASCGFRREAFYPCYGLAEATLLVTGGPKGIGPVVRTIRGAAIEEGQVVAAAAAEPGARTLVGCGRTWLGQEVLIADPVTRSRCPAETVGEVWVAGPSVAQGYWERPEETAAVFGGHLADSGEGPYLRTGDLGFIQDGELFLTGRLKDLIVLRGRNHYPQDIEETVQAVHPGLRAGAGAAFEIIREGRPALVVVQEVDRLYRREDLSQVIGDVRQAVAERHEVQVHDVQLLEYGSIPRTSSGKVQRHRCRIGYEQGTLCRWKRGGA
jgi:acyl-CoA synthetase (AMP-forming)/AMP-acid ligase II